MERRAKDVIERISVLTEEERVPTDLPGRIPWLMVVEEGPALLDEMVKLHVRSKCSIGINVQMLERPSIVERVSSP